MNQETFTFNGRKYNPHEARDAVRDLFDRMHSGWTDEDLLTRPADARHFCAVVRETLKAGTLEDSRILGLLIGARKKGGRAFGKRPGSVRLAVELKASQVLMTPDEFRDTLADLFHASYRDMTDEAILRDTLEAGAFCASVRRRVSYTLPDALICRTLLNIRKGGRRKSARADG